MKIIYIYKGLVHKCNCKYKCAFCVNLKPSDSFQWPSDQGAGFPIQGSHVQNHWVAPRSTQPFILPRSVK